MKPTVEAVHRESGFGEAPSPLDVLVLYEDAASAVRAKHLVDQLVEHVNLIVSFRLDLCRFDLLSMAPPGRSEAGETRDCDILFLAAHGHDDLPSTVWSWLDRWFSRDPLQPRAVVMSLDERSRNFAVANQIQYFLQAAACRAGVEVFCHFGENRYSELDCAIAGVRYRAETTSALLDETLHRAGSTTFRFWGIND